MFSGMSVHLNGWFSASNIFVLILLWLTDNVCIVSDGTSVIVVKFCGNQFGS